MSYILEALKKLEQKRKREEGTQLLSDQQPAERRPKRRPLLLYLISLALLLNAAFILWWLRPWQQPRSRGNSAQFRETITEDSRPGAMHPPEDSGASGMVSPAPPAVKSMPAAPERLTDETAPSVADEDDERLSPVSQQPPEKQGQHTISINELPPSLRLTLPDLAISGHFFDSGPSSRVVIIGGRTLHEGQTVAPGLKLEQITRDGAVFSYQGYRFKENVF